MPDDALGTDVTGGRQPKKPAAGKGMAKRTNSAPGEQAVGNSGAASDRPPPPGRLRDGMLALWPVIGITGMAVLGELFGGGAALLVALAVIGSLVWFIGEEYDRKRWRLMLVGAVVCLAAPVAFFYAKGAPALREAPSGVVQTRTSTTTTALAVANLRGRTVTQHDLGSRSLAGAVVDGATLNEVRLPGGHLENLQAEGTTFFRVDLADAHLTGANLRGAVFVQSDLRRADLARADLRGTDLRLACLVGADFTGASVAGANAGGAATTGVIVDPATLATAAQWQAPSAATTSADCP